VVLSMLCFARQLFTGLQEVVNHWLFHSGFGIGIADTIADKQAMMFIKEHIASGSKTSVTSSRRRTTIVWRRPRVWRYM
jgi:hypothetical protein